MKNQLGKYDQALKNISHSIQDIQGTLYDLEWGKSFGNLANEVSRLASAGAALLTVGSAGKFPGFSAAGELTPGLGGIYGVEKLIQYIEDNTGGWNIHDDMMDNYGQMTDRFHDCCW